MTRINYGIWFWRVISWDTVVPACLLLFPYAIEALFPKAEDVFVIAAVVLPIVAIFLREHAGKRQIAQNNCSRRTRQLQHSALLLGITPLLFVDGFFIVVHALGPRPKNARPVGMGPWLLLAGVLGFYLLAMIVAMYPGRTISAED